jgi:crotonobetaine/carnitine-CoA ligase
VNGQPESPRPPQPHGGPPATRAEAELRLREWSRLSPIDPAYTLPRLLSAFCSERPDAPFLRTVGGTSRTYAEFDRRVRRWVSALQSLCVGHGDRVLVMLPTSIEALEIWGALAAIGAIEVPVHTAYRGALLQRVLANAEPKVLVVASELLPQLQTASNELGEIPHILVAGVGRPEPPGTASVEALLNSVAEAEELYEPLPQDLACILYTSGTTGPSKGVCISWAQIVATATGAIPYGDLTADDVRYVPLPLFHVGGKSAFYSTFLAGGQIVLRERFSTSDFWSDIHRFACTTTSLIGVMPNFLYRQPERPEDSSNPLRNTIMNPVIREVKDFERRFGLRVCTSFNMTELSTPIVTGWAIQDPRSCGRVRPGYEARVVDEQGCNLPPGAVGELLVRAGLPEVLTSGYFAVTPAAELYKDGWLATGYLFSYDEVGQFAFIDRKKDSIRRRGENISSWEVENEVKSHPAVLETAAVPVPSEWGEEEVKIVVVRRDNQDISARELVDYLGSRLPNFMIPRYVEFVNDLPRTPSEKVAKNLLLVDPVNSATWDRLEFEE